MKHPKKWWSIRRIRYVVLADRVYRHAWRWGTLGIGLGIPNDADLAHLKRIWDGDA